MPALTNHIIYRPVASIRALILCLKWHKVQPEIIRAIAQLCSHCVHVRDVVSDRESYPFWHMYGTSVLQVNYFHYNLLFLGYITLKVSFNIINIAEVQHVHGGVYYRRLTIQAFPRGQYTITGDRDSISFSKPFENITLESRIKNGKTKSRVFICIDGRMDGDLVTFIDD